MAWQELFGTDNGLLSVFTISFVLVMAVFIGKFVSSRMNEDAHKQH